MIYAHLRGQVDDAPSDDGLDDYEKAELVRKGAKLTYLQLKVDRQDSRISALESILSQKQTTIDNLSAELGRLKRKINKQKKKATGADQ